MSRGHKKGIITDFTSRAPIVRSYVQLFEQLCVALADQPRRLVVVTSPGRGEGRTSVTANLGLCCSRLGGQRTLMVDGDLEKPALASRFRKANSDGLVRVLRGSGTWRECSENLDPQGQLALLSGGTVAPSAIAATPTTRLTELLAEWREAFEWVLFDTPPVLSSSESLLLGRHAAGAILVARAEQTREEVLSLAAARLKESGIKILGVVLNGRRFVIPRYAYRRL